MKYLIICFICLLSLPSFGQDKTLTLDDAILSYSRGLRPKGLKNIQWAGSSNAYSYISNDKLTIVDRQSKTETTIVARVLNPDFEIFPAIKWIDAHTFRFKDGAAFMSYDINTRLVTRIISHPQEAQNIDLNMTSKSVAYTIDNDLYMSTPSVFNKAIVDNKDHNVVSGQAIARSEFGITKGTFWSPDGKYLAFYEKDETNVADYPLLDITKTPGALRLIKYPMAGQGSEISSVGVYNMKKEQIVYLQNSHIDDHYYTNVAWSENGKKLFVSEVNRDQNHMWLNQYNPKSGEFIETLYEETNDAWVEPEQPVQFYNSTDFLLFSEKNGFTDLYRYIKNGYKEKQLTSGQGEMHKIIGFTNKKKAVFLQGTGKDPRDRHVFKVNIKKGNPVQLTKTAGVHTGQISPDGKYVLDQYSNLTTPLNIDIIDVDNLSTETIYSAPNPLADYVMPSLEFLKVPADGYVLNARIIKPSNFDPTKKYPVLVYVYGGPHAQMITNRWGGGAAMWMSWMAEQGYIVFTLDNRGSANLGFAMESQIHRQVGTVEMEDQMLGVAYLKNLPYVDGERLAVHGWSFGGFMTLSLMLRQAGTFNVGVAGGPVTDWKWYEVMYGERYMDTPAQNPEGYAANSLLNYVEKLEGKLLTIHGGIDDVVVMQHDLGFLRACIEKGVQTDFYTYPTHPHNVRGKDRIHLMTKVLNYVIDNNK